MSSKMVVRILSISLALILLGMVAPSLSNASVATAGEVDLGQVLINSSPASTTFAIQNQNEQSWVALNFNLSGTCGFLYDATLQGRVLGIKGEANDTVSMTIQYAPSELGVCSDTLTVYYYANDYKLHEVYVVLTAEGVDKLGPSTVVIDGHDTGVENRLHEEQTVSERLDKCSENAKNHGEYVRCVALMTRMLRKAEVLSEEEGQTIVKAAAHANIPPLESGLEDLVLDDRPVTELIKECKEKAENNRQYVRCVSHLMKEMKKEGVIKTRKDKHQIRRYAARLRFHSKHHK